MATNDLQQQIQDHFEDPYHRGRCDYPTHVAEVETPCPFGGDKDSHSTNDLIAVELRIEEGQLSEIWFDGRGCTSSLAIASMLAESLEGQRTDDVSNLSLEAALRNLNITLESGRESCFGIALKAIQSAIESATIEMEDGPTFGGPDLGDEC